MMKGKAIHLPAVLLVLALGILISCGGCSKKTSTVTGVEEETSKEAPAVAGEDKALPGPSAALSFSADYVSVQGPNKASGKSYVKGNKNRMEITEGDMKSITIVRGDKNLVWMLDPDKKMYMEMSMDAGSQASMIGPEAEKMLEDLGERKLVGQETVNGYLCDKYEFIYHDKTMGKQTHWMSKKLGVMIKMEHPDPNYPMSLELRNINEQKVSDSLFEIPSGYTKMDIPMMPGP